MMDAFRGSKKIVGVVFTLLMVIFVLTSVDLSKFTGSSSVGKIEGTRVEARTFEELVRQQTEQAQKNTAAPLSLEETQAIRDQVWESLVQNTVLEKEYERRGIAATDDEVVAFIQSNPPPDVQQAPEFQTNGRFDPAKYQRWLSSAAAQPAIPYLEAQARDQIKRVKLFRLVTADVFTSDPALWEHYQDEHEQATIELAAIIPRNAVPDSAVSVTTAEVQNYYDKHRDEFKRPETAFLSYVALPRVLTAADTAAARQRALDLRQEITGGAPFAEVAKRESSDSVSGAQGGELGWWKRGQMDPAFDSAAFALPLEKVSEPVLSSFGFHLIEVEARHGDSAQARHILVPIELSGARRDAFDARADTLDRLAAEQLDPAALDSAAHALGLTVGRTDPVQKGTRAVVGNFVVPDAGVWAFQSKQGELSPLIETSRGLFVFRLDSTAAEGVPPLASIRPAVEAAVRLQKKWEKAHELAQRFVQRLDAGAPFGAAADSMGFPHQQLGPFTRVNPPLPNPAVIGAAFGLQAGRHSPVLDTPDGLYVIKVVGRTPADSADFAKQEDELRARAIQLARQQRVQSFLKDLRKNAKVEDNRAEAYRNGIRAQAQS